MNECEGERMNVASSSDFWEHLDKLHVERERERERRDLGHAEKRGGWHLWRERERGKERCTHYLHSEKGVGSQSSPPFRRREKREGEIKVAEWRFLLREFGELVKRVILFDAATDTATTPQLTYVHEMLTAVGY